MDNFTGLGVFVDTYPNEEKVIEVQKDTMPSKLLEPIIDGLDDITHKCSCIFVQTGCFLCFIAPNWR